jgi:hypothetical protein
LARKKIGENLTPQLSQPIFTNEKFSLTPPLQGRVEYINTRSGCYGVYVSGTFCQEGKVYHTKLYLGKVENQVNNIYYSKKYDRYFKFSLEDGFDEFIDPQYIQLASIPKNYHLNFGDIWMIDQTYKQTGLESVLNTLIPDSADTLKALVAYRLSTKNDAYCHAEEWYRKSYANKLYPQARLDSPRISEFHAILGEEDNYRKFFRFYLNLIGKKEIFNDNKPIPILIDSTGIPNSINTHLTAINNHNGKVSNEMRIIYVVDKNSKLPIFFRYVPGNIVDNSTLITTMNNLMTYDINIDIAIMDAGYCSMNNLKQLLDNNIPFLLRMSKNRKDYKQLMIEHGHNLLKSEYALSYGERGLFGKKVEITLFDKQVYAYVMLDIDKMRIDLNQKLVNSSFDNQEELISQNFIDSAGRFILLSSQEYNINDILPLYYTRQIIEQVFDIGKSYTGMTPIRGHSEDTIRGILLISFLATAIYSYISHGLVGSKYSTQSALICMHNHGIKFFESVTVLEELTKQQKEIYSQLKLECPYPLESDNPFQNAPFTVSPAKKKRGRPAGRCNKSSNHQDEPAIDTSQFAEAKRLRGRPKGSKNKPKDEPAIETSQFAEAKRLRGRPKGSKNKPKDEPGVMR